MKNTNDNRRTAPSTSLKIEMSRIAETLISNGFELLGMLRRFEQTTVKNSQVDMINLQIRGICAFYGTSSDTMKTRDRHGRVSQARHIVCFLLRRDFDLSFPQIGRLLGRKHSSVIHACRRVTTQIEQSPDFGRLLERLAVKKQINGHSNPAAGAEPVKTTGKETENAR